ncbi:MAG: CpsB/CapC family capsule biosynthesis tyrosine phosphatase [Syntrophobacteraceae bacterium]
MIDTHSHILPGLDDGVEDLDQAVEAARIAVQDGIEGMICTPHWINGIYENTRTVVMEAIESLEPHLKEHDIPLALYPGMELRIDPDLPGRISERELLTLNESAYALIELPAELIPPRIEAFFHSLQVERITPIIAHPERNPGLAKDPGRLYEWIESGALTQLTAGSLLGKFGGTVRKFCLLMLEHGMVHLIATDCHGPRNRAPKLSRAFKETEATVGKTIAARIFRENPMEIVKRGTVAPFELSPLGGRFSLPLKKCFSFFKRGK